MQFSRWVLMDGFHLRPFINGWFSCSVHGLGGSGLTVGSHVVFMCWVGRAEAFKALAFSFSQSGQDRPGYFIIFSYFVWTNSQSTKDKIYLGWTLRFLPSSSSSAHLQLCPILRFKSGLKWTGTSYGLAPLHVTFKIMFLFASSFLRFYRIM